MKTFQEETLSRLSNDESDLAKRNEDSARVAITSQLSELNGLLVDADADIADATRALENSFYPTELIGKNRKSYISTINRTEADLARAVENRENILLDIEFYRTALNERFQS